MEMDATLLGGPGGTALFVRCIIPDAPWASLVLVHGSMVHSEYYLPLALALAESGVATFLPDLRGHGRSDGLRAHVAEFRHHVDDARSVLAYVRQVLDVPAHLGGESYGGLIAFLAAAGADRAEAPASVVMAAPAFALRAQVPPRLRTSLRLVGQAVPALRLPVYMHLTGVSRRPDLDRLAARDPLLNRQYTIGFFCELLRAQEAARATARDVRVPCLALLGGDDRVTDNEATRAVLAQAPYARSRLYPDFMHAVLSEDVPTVRRDIVDFLAAGEAQRPAASAP
jgi:alpha-beta hydrolase superfamily lysophospholipase